MLTGQSLASCGVVRSAFSAGVYQSVCSNLSQSLVFMFLGIGVASVACLFSVWTYDVSRAHHRYGIGWNGS
jgi:hypothetical protein